MLSCIIVDDEPLALELLEKIVSKISFLQIKECFNSAQKAKDFIKTNSIDLVFLDIQMPGINGLELAKLTNENTMVIFTTAFDQYAVEGFNIDAVDYLLKPIEKGRLLAAAEKALQIYKWKNLSVKEDYIFVNSQHQIIKIFVNDIIYIEGLKDYVKIFIKNYSKPVLTRMNLKGMEKIVEGFNLERCHKSYIVNKDQIKVRDKDSLQLGNFIIPIGLKYKKQFNNW